MNKDRLMVLRDHMLKLQADRDAGREPERGFYMGNWIMDRDRFDKQNEEAVFNGWSCDTACCLLGEAAFIPALSAQGLKVIRNRRSTGEIQFDIWVDEYAGREFFGLNEKETDFLFMPHKYYDDFAHKSSYHSTNITPGMTVAHIDRVLAGEFRDEEVL